MKLRTLLLLAACYCASGLCFAQSPGLTVVTVSSSATPTLTTNAGFVTFVWTLSTNVTSSTFSSAAVGAGALVLCEDGTGGRTVVFPANFVNFQPLLQTNANYCQYYTWEYDGTNVKAIGWASAISFASLTTGTVAAAGIFPAGDLLFNNSLTTGTITANRLACITASNTIGNCTALPANNIVGVFDGTGGNFAQVGAHSVALDATVNVTFGDILCASTSTGSLAHDNGSVACATGEWVGIVQTTASSVSTATAILRLQ